MKFYNIFIYLFYIPYLNSFLIQSYPLTYIHLDKFDKNLNLIHIGISFEQGDKIVRYDYRKNKILIRKISLEGDKLNELKIYWGLSKKSLIEIENYQKILNKKKYILAINDCRHFTRDLTDWALEKPTPIWKLNKLYEDMITN